MTAPKWHDGYLVSLDTETTGVDVHSDRIVTAAIVHAKLGHRPRTLTWVIDPGVPIPAEAAAIHGWTNDRIRQARGVKQPAQALFEIAGQVALAMSTRTPLVVFNAAFDLSILEAECRRHGVPTVAERLAPRPLAGVVDPFVIDKHYSRRKGSRKLTDQCSHYKVILAGAHDAGADALATLRLTARMVTAYPELSRMSLTRLHESQIGWRREQMNSLRAYFDSKSIDHDGCCPDWPLQAALAVADIAQGALL